jgi:DNA-binding NtrC family response regulator
LAATHRDLDAFVRAGKLREDLYHRIVAHVLRVPSLAERRFDVPELFVHVLGTLRDAHPALSWLWAGADEWRPSLPIGFVADLIRRPWSGNVRELANLAQRTARLNLHPGAFEAPFDESALSTGPIAVGPAPGGNTEPGGSARRAPSPSAPDDEATSSGASAPVSGSEGAASGSPQEEAIVRSAGESLGIARKTLLKLLSRSAMVELAAEADRHGFADPERTRRLRAAAAEALLSMLEARDFNQSSVAAALGASRTTLIKLMDDLGLPRATDLDAATIQRARTQAGGDLDAAARLLRVSPSALKKRLTMLNLKE